MAKYSDEVLAKLAEYKHRLVDSCDLCSGSGYVIDSTTGEDETCYCMSVFRYVKALTVAGIPIAYWHLRLQDLTDVAKEYRGFVENYLRHLKSAADHALGIFFLGANGIGKTALMCEIGKHAIVRGFSVKYFTAQQYINACRVDAVEEFTTSKMLLLDEVEKAYIKEGSTYVPKMIEDFLRRVLAAGKIVVATSNESVSGLEEMFGVSTLSMIRRHLKLLSMEGEDRGDRMQEQWEETLEAKYDLFHRNIVRMAELKRKYDEDR